MSQRSRRRNKNQVEPSVSPPLWTGAPCLELVHAFNERFLELLTQAARIEGEPSSLHIVQLHRDLWISLDSGARQLVAGFPFLLIDIQFHSKDWWLLAKELCSPEMTPHPSPSLFSDRLAIEVMYEAVVLAWHIARSDIRAASVLLAMSPDVALAVSKLGLRDITHIAEYHHNYLRPRWEHIPLFWRHLLVAARSGNHSAIHGVHLHGLQLLGTESLSFSDRAHNQRQSAQPDCYPSQ